MTFGEAMLEVLKDPNVRDLKLKHFGEVRIPFQGHTISDVIVENRVRLANKVSFSE